MQKERRRWEKTHGAFELCAFDSELNGFSFGKRLTRCIVENQIPLGFGGRGRGGEERACTGWCMDERE